MSRPRTHPDPGADRRGHAGRAAASLALAALVAAVSSLLVACKREQPTPSEPANGGGAATSSVDDPTRDHFPSDDDALVRRNNRGVGLMGRFAYEEARVVFDELAAGHPGEHDVRVNLAIATLNRQQDGDEQAALDILESVLAASPRHARANYVAGILQLRAGAMREAAERLEIAYERAPDDSHAAYFLGQAIEPDDPERALELYERAIDIDPWLRSAYYRAFLVLRRIGDPDRAQARLERFQALQEDPRARTAELVYTKMGRLAEAKPAGAPGDPVAPRPDGPVFAAARGIDVRDAAGAALDPAAWSAGGAASITVADVDGDGRLDLYMPGALDPATAPDGARNALLLAVDGGAYRLETALPLAHVPDVLAVAWADVDGDGGLDVVLGRDGPDQWWRGSVAEGGGPRTWTDASAALGAAAAGGRTNDVLVVDADHDGDLDVLLARDGPDLFLAGRSGDGFDEVAASLGLAGDDRPTRRFLAGDLDGTRDLDLVAIHAAPPHRLHHNDRAWRWSAGEGGDPDPGAANLLQAAFRSVAAADLDGDGRTDLVAHEDDALVRWSLSRDAGWRRTPLALGLDPARPATFAVVDVDGDGRTEVVLATVEGPVVVPTAGGALARTIDVAAPAGAAALVLEDPARGLALAWTGADGDASGPRLAAPGDGRFAFTAVTFSGRTDVGQAMRSNASGIGTRVAARAGATWTVVRDLPSRSGPGQSRQPIAIGLAGRERLDYLAIDWSDGVFQSEVPGLARVPGESPTDFGPGDVERIVETQRQLSSCPVIFVWDGERWRFVSDVLGVGGMGYLLEPGIYAPPRPWERFLMPGDTFASRDVIRDGMWQLRLHEPMEEAVYLDHAALVAWDLPPGWDLVLDERMGLAEPLPTGAPVFFREAHHPAAATNDRGEDVTAALVRVDGTPADPGPRDARFLGRLERDHVLELVFHVDLDELAEGAGRPVLVADGWVEYPYSQTNFAAWQAGAAWRPPTIEARGADGRWRTVLFRFGYPGGMPRTMSVPLDDLPAGTRTLRITSNLDIHWDRIAVVRGEPLAAIEPPPIRREPSLVRAELRRTGFPRRDDGPHRRPHYDDAHRAPVADMRHQAGWYTAFGDVADLVTTRDDLLAVYGPGEEVLLGFTPPPADPPAGWRRRVVLDVTGWCKDMDLFTRDGDTVGPLPSSDGDADAAARRHEPTRTRYEAGR